MFDPLVTGYRTTILLTGFLVSSILSCTAFAHSADEQSGPLPPAPSKTEIAPKTELKPSTYPGNWRAREGVRNQRNWGVDIVGIRPVSSGYMLAFRYRVVDPEKARLLNDKRSKAYLIDEATENVLGVPIMENLGEMRQKAAPEANHTYFVMFGNPGKLVKSGSRVSVVIGDFRLDGLVVD